MAKKSKGFRELFNQQQADQIQQRGMEKLRQKLQQVPVGEIFTKIVTNPKDEVKMSDVLEEFVTPYLDFTIGFSERQKLFALAIFAWNLALMPEQERPTIIRQMMNQGLVENDPLIRQDIREVINELIDRKKTHFADNKRYIIEFELQDLGDQFHLSVASTSGKQPIEE